MRKITKRIRREVARERRALVVTLYPETAAMAASIGIREIRQRDTSEKRIELRRLHTILAMREAAARPARRRRVKRGLL